MRASQSRSKNKVKSSAHALCHVVSARHNETSPQPTNRRGIYTGEQVLYAFFKNKQKFLPWPL